MAKSDNMNVAKKEKNDEFYTQLHTIEDEMKHYTKYFKGKTIFCNCDDPKWSEFFNFFYLNIEHLKIKKLITTHFDPNENTYKLEVYNDKKDIDHLGLFAIQKTPLKSNGDFRSAEVIEILKEADIIVTNPPFSLFREYVNQLVSNRKKFIIIGNINAVTCKEIFPLIQKNKMWQGYSTGGFKFRVPEDSTKDNIEIGSDGLKYAKFGNITWYTNLPTSKREEKIILYKEFSEKEYPTYDNYDAINVNKVSDIPKNYYGKMGVPISFISKYNPKQFNIIGLDSLIPEISKGRCYVNGKRKFARIIIQARGEKNEN